MNYDKYIKNTYSISETLNNDLDILLFLSDGSTYQDNFYNAGDYTYFNEACDYAYVTYKQLSSSADLVGFMIRNQDGNYNLVLRNNLDFVKFDYFGNSNYVDITCADYYQVSTGGYYPFEDGGDLLNTYLVVDSEYPLTYTSISTVSYDISLEANEKSVYDFSNTNYALDYRIQSYPVNFRGEIEYFYFHAFNISGNIDYLNISVGSPIYDEYARGYSKGYSEGYYDGYDIGWDDGYNFGSGVDRIDKNTHNTFSYIAEGFKAVNNVLEIEVLPHVTLGLCFSIPFVIGMMTILFKLIKR